MQLVRFDPEQDRGAFRMSRYRVPTHCAFCETAGTVSLTARTPGGAVAIRLNCRRCKREWPVRPEEQIPERRSGLTDRRRASRADRRNRNNSQ